MSKPKISIIIPLYNKVDSIYRTITSVLKQTYSNLDIIVVDDGSTDGSDEVIKNISDQRIRYLLKNNGGVSSARNFGVINATGEYIIFLDADDVFLPDAVEILFRSIIENCVICACANFYIQTNGIQIPYSNYQSGFIKKPFKDWFWRRFCPRTGAAIFKRDILLKFPFPENISRYEDAKMLFDIMRSYVFYYTDNLVMIYTDANRGLSKFCKDSEKDFVFHMNHRGKSFWEKMVMARLLIQGWHGYPFKRGILVKKYISLFPYSILGKILYTIDMVGKLLSNK